MPVHNHINFLPKSIGSILTQTYYDFEFIIIDDASQEPVEIVVKSYQDPRIVFVKNFVNMGLTKSLNKALQVAKGDLIARHDSDDIALPTRFAEEVRIFIEEDIGLVSCWGKAIDAHGCYIPDTWLDYIIRQDEETIVKLLSRKVNSILAPGAIFRREVVQKIGFFDEEVQYAQDYNYWLRLLTHFKLRIVSKDLVLKRVHSDVVWASPKERDWLSFAYDRAMAYPIIHKPFLL